MKKRLMLILLCIATVLSVCLFGCNSGKVDATAERVAITVKTDDKDETLLEYMEDLQEDGKLTYTVDKGMITKLNGVSNTTNCYWMLYTSDTANANTAWGTCEYNGETLGSSTLGAESLIVKDGCVYVWVYTKF